MGVLKISVNEAREFVGIEDDDGRIAPFLVPFLIKTLAVVDDDVYEL